MKITDLQVDGFGVWNDLTIDEISPDMTIFYGRNEAGKTTLMQFIRSVFYGYTVARRGRYVPPVYGGTAGGSLYVYNGEQQLQLQRLDAGEASPVEGDLAVVSSQGHQYGEDYLVRLLSGVDESIFNNVFAIGLTEIQELSSLNGTEAARELYKLASGVDRVSLVDVMASLTFKRKSLLNQEGTDNGQLVELFGRHRELTRKVESKADQGRYWLSLIDQRRDAERLLRDRKDALSGLESKTKRLETAIQVQPSYEKWRSKERELAALDNLPDERDVDTDKLAKLKHRMNDFERRIMELQARADGLKSSADQLPINKQLWKHAARIEALSEHQHWIASLTRQAERLRAEVERLETGEDTGHGDSTHGASVSRTALKKLGPFARRYKVAQQALESSKKRLAEQELELQRVREQLDVAMLENNCESLGESFQHAGQLVSMLRKRQGIDDRLDQLNQQRKNAEAELDEAIQDQVFSTQRLLGVGAFVVIGTAMILGGWSGLILKSMPTNPLLGFLGCGIVMAGLGLKRYWEYEAQDEVDQAKQRFDVVREELLKVREEREELDAALPEGLGQIDGRLHDAQRRLSILERLMPLEGRVSEVTQTYEQAQVDHEAAVERRQDAERNWRDALLDEGLSEDLSPTQVKRLSERSREYDQARSRLLEARQQLEQFDDDLASIHDRVMDLYADVGLEADEAYEALDLLKALESELRSQQGLMDQRQELAQQYRQLRQRKQQIQNRQQKLRLFRSRLLTRAGVTTDEEYVRLGDQLQKRNLIRGEVQTLEQNVHASVGHQYTSLEIFEVLDETPLSSLQANLSELQEKVEALQLEQEELHEKRGELSQQIKQLADEDELEQAKLELKEVEEEIRFATEQWQEHAATSVVLESLREFYEAHRQPETLRAASAHLAQITGGRYTRLWTRMVGNELLVDGDDETALPIQVLSRGTREAVFLSLRMALVEAYKKRGVSLPMVLDDVLVNFDAERAQWAAEVLKNFAEAGHQLLMFTCHEHMAEMFEQQGCDVRVLPYHRDVVHQAATVVPRENETLVVEEIVEEQPLAVIEEIEQTVEEAIVSVEPEPEPELEPEPVAIEPPPKKKRRRKKKPAPPQEPVFQEEVVAVTERKPLEWESTGLWWQGEENSE